MEYQQLCLFYYSTIKMGKIEKRATWTPASAQYWMQYTYFPPEKENTQHTSYCDLTY
jgi:hypothetical protein